MARELRVHKITKRIYAILVILFCCLLVLGGYQVHYAIQKAYCEGWRTGHNAYEPQPVYVEVQKTVTKEVPVEVIREIPVPIEHEVREFKDLRELGDFLRGIDVQGHKQPHWDCDDFAYYVWVEAHKVGFLMSVETDYKKGQLHALNSTIIDNNVYYIESQNGMIWLFCYRD